jgi:small conductance mechanosensitive channel
MEYLHNIDWARWSAPALSGLRIALIVVLAWVSISVLQRAVRMVRLRDYDGNVHFIPNGRVTTVTNMSRSFAHAVVDVGVSYRENVDEVMAAMAEVGAQLRTDPAHAARMLADLEIAGVERLDDSAVVLRCRGCCAISRATAACRSRWALSSERSRTR